MIANREKAQQAIDIISGLIVNSAGLLSQEQHQPRSNPDSSDEYMAEHTRYVKELRDIRERLENLITGVAT